MTSKLGTYWSVEHRRKEDYAYFAALQPAAHLIMDGGPPDYAFVHDNEPNTLTLARDWAMSEQHSDMLRDPATTGIRHAREWNDHQKQLGFERARTLILGINEPKVWEPGVATALRTYTIALCEEAAILGLRVGAMQLGVGWPNNNGPDTPPDWSPWAGVEEAIRRGNHVLVTHEYWADSGPSENWGWWAGRTLKCPWQVPIIIGECGVDMFVKDTSVGQQNRGWLGHMPPERYANELWEYTNRMSIDPRFVGCCVFASDFQAHEWYSFDVAPAYNAILGVKPADIPPVTTHLPSIQTPTQTLYVAAPAGLRLRAEPDTGSESLDAAPYGSAIQTTGASDDGQWTQVVYNEKTGWMYRPLLSDKLAIPQPPPEPAQPTGDNFQRSLEWVLKWEGGYQNIANDSGNWTGCEVGKGENRGTKYGISACSYPQLDIPNLSIQEATAIYQADYWRASGADELSWPYCLLMFDTAVLHGVGTARKWQEEGGVANPYLFAAKRLRSYTQLSNWDFWGKSWTQRTADLLAEMGKA